jgi:hypothetical protein
MASLLHAIVYHVHSERLDSFRHKRYTTPEVVRFGSVTIEAEVIDENGNEVMLRPTAQLPHGVPERFVVALDRLRRVADSNEIHQRSIHGAVEGANKWKYSDGNLRPVETL